MQLTIYCFCFLAFSFLIQIAQNPKDLSRSPSNAQWIEERGITGL